MKDLFERMQARYREGDLPWDDVEPPPEVVEIARVMQPGRMLDLGCGGGRASIYLARHGWHCTGVDFVPEAIELAQRRACEMEVEEHVRLYVASVTDLSFLAVPYDLAVDIGCLHGQDEDDMPAYAAEVRRLVRAGGRYLLFARMYDEQASGGPRGVSEHHVRALFEKHFSFDRVEHGVTHSNTSSWNSAWFWLTRHEGL
jgi:cyclopropane fatty-acyl-phospholipid synthase-like methyltransferase